MSNNKSDMQTAMEMVVNGGAEIPPEMQEVLDEHTASPENFKHLYNVMQELQNDNSKLKHDVKELYKQNLITMFVVGAHIGASLIYIIIGG